MLLLLVRVSSPDQTALVRTNKLHTINPDLDLIVGLGPILSLAPLCQRSSSCGNIKAKGIFLPFDDYQWTAVVPSQSLVHSDFRENQLDGPISYSRAFLHSINYLFLFFLCNFSMKGSQVKQIRFRLTTGKDGLGGGQWPNQLGIAMQTKLMLNL